MSEHRSSSATRRGRRPRPGLPYDFRPGLLRGLLRGLGGSALVLAGCGPPETIERPPSILLVTLDTLRADALGCYGNDLEATPSLDRLAAEGTLFEHAYTPVPLTLPAHCSALTGLLPPRHGVHFNGGRPLPEEARSLAELAQEAGMETAAFVASAVLAAEYGLDQGFDSYDAPTGAGDPGGRSGTEVTRKSITWLNERDPSRPFFLWVHLFDAHDPYEPPEPFVPPPNVHPYYGEVALVDTYVGALLAWLQRKDLLDDTFVLVAGDHGEALGEHGEATHGDFVHDVTLRVPMILRGPGIAAGRRVAQPVGLVDVAPTLAEAVGLGWPRGADGTSVLGLSSLSTPDAEVGEAPWPRPGLYFECFTGYASYGWSPLAGWRSPEGKYEHSAEPRLFQPALEPDEAHDLLASDGDLDLGRYRDALEGLFDAPSLVTSDAAPTGTTPQAIRDLGYAAFETSLEIPSPLAPTSRPAPWRMRAQHERALQANAHVTAGAYAEAEEILQSIVAENPLHWTAWDRLALARFGREDYAGALDALDELLVGRPSDANAHLFRGGSLWKLGLREDALEAMDTAFTLSPDDASIRSAYAEALEADGREEEAQRVRAAR